MRKIPTQVPSAVSRLLQSTQLQSPPVWYGPVLANPPPILPARQTPPRHASAQDLPRRHQQQTESRSHKMSHLKEPKPRPKDIVYQEDHVRRQFFKDFPFEALRPVSLVEGTHVGSNNLVEGTAWTALSQRGAYPTVEDCVQFTLSLQRHHELPLTQAYSIATKEFAKLRAAHELATQAAEAEARAHGASFTSDPWARTMEKERQYLDSLAPSSSSSSTTATRVKYRKPPSYAWTQSVPPASVPQGEFSGGRAYVGRWTLPPPVQSETAPAGDLMSEIPDAQGAAASEPAPEVEVEMAQKVSART